MKAHVHVLVHYVMHPRTSFKRTGSVIEEHTYFLETQS